MRPGFRVESARFLSISRWFNTLCSKLDLLFSTHMIKASSLTRKSFPELFTWLTSEVMTLAKASNFILAHKIFEAMLVNITNIFAKQIQELYNRGATYFWIHNTGPFGCVPFQTCQVRNPPPEFLDKHGCIRWQNERALRFNALLKETVAQLKESLSQSAIT